MHRVQLANKQTCHYPVPRNTEVLLHCTEQERQLSFSATPFLQAGQFPIRMFCNRDADSKSFTPACKRCLLDWLTSIQPHAQQASDVRCASFSCDIFSPCTFHQRWLIVHSNWTSSHCMAFNARACIGSVESEPRATLEKRALLHRWLGLNMSVRCTQSHAPDFDAHGAHWDGAG